MIYILLSIICSAILVLLFRVFQNYKVNTFQAIYFNYFTCVASAWVALGSFPIPADLTTKNWFPFAIILGFVFITGFNAVAGTVEKFNVALASIMQKMTIVFVVTFSIFYLGESANWQKILGVILCIAAIFFTSYTTENQEDTKKKKTTLMDWILYPIAALVLSAVIDILLSYLQKKMNTGGTDISFIASLFASAGCIGTVYLSYALLTKRMFFEWKNVLAGIVLGIPNFASIYYLLKALEVNKDSSVVFPIVNVGIIVTSTVLAWLIFKEPFTRNKTIGVLLAIAAIALIAYSGS
jgi:drug/metabolite transporter (DMT)-like permease